MDKHDLQQVRRVSNALRTYAPHIGEQELTDILCDFASHGTLFRKIPYLGEERIRLIYKLVWDEGYTVAQILDPAAASQQSCGSFAASGNSDA